MADHTCKRCGKVYDVSHKDSDQDFCSFECWEKVNCLDPVPAPIEEFITIPE